MKPSGGSHLLFRNLKDVQIIADGVEMICTATVQAVGFDHCTNVTLRGLTIDYDPLPFTQGKIVALGRKRAGWNLNCSTAIRKMNWWRESRFSIPPPANCGGRAITAGVPSSALDHAVIGFPRGSNYRYRPQVDTEQVGDLLVTNNRTPERGGGHAVLLTDCSSVTLQDVTLYASPTFGFLEMDCTGSTYLRCRIDRRAPADDPVPRASPRLRSLNADAFHSKNAAKGPAIIECFAHWQGDDCVNINGRYYFVAGSQGRTVRIVVTGGNPLIMPGDLVEFLPYAGGPLPKARAVSIAPAAEPLSAAEQALLREVKLVGTVRQQFSRNAKVYSLVLDREINPPPGSAVCAAVTHWQRICSEGLRLRGQPLARHPHQGQPGRSDGQSSSSESRMAAVLISPEFEWMEAGCSSDVVVKDNVFRGIGQTPIRILADGGNGKPLPAGAHRNISVFNNRFEDCPWPLVEANSITGPDGGGQCLATTRAAGERGRQARQACRSSAAVEL